VTKYKSSDSNFITNYAYLKRICVLHGSKRLDSELANIIRDMYLTTDISYRSIWTADVKKNNFVIKILNPSNGSNEWIEDVKGKHLLNLIIDPLCYIIKRELVMILGYLAQWEHNKVDDLTYLELPQEYKELKDIDLDLIFKKGPQIMEIIDMTTLQNGILSKIAEIFL
jgi:hypothetical protein